MAAKIFDKYLASLSTSVIKKQLRWVLLAEIELLYGPTYCHTTEVTRLLSRNLYITKEITQLLRKGKYHCTADLLFDWLGFSCFAYVELDRDLQVWSNPIESNRSAIQ